MSKTILVRKQDTEGYLPVDDVEISQLPKEYLRIEYPNEWKYLEKLRRTFEGVPYHY
jgi:hypothetical protein